MKSFFEEFKKFAIRGNVVDLAVAVVIGTAFGKIVSSLVDNVITPVIGLLMGGVDFSGYATVVGDSVIAFGKFIQSVVDFTIVALVIFLVVKGMNRLKRKEEVSEAKHAEPSEEVSLLREIRDALKR